MLTLRPMLNAALGILLVWVLIPAESYASQAVDTVRKVSQQIEDFRTSLPDFVCTEKISSTQEQRGEPTRRAVVESIFTARQDRSRTHLEFTESRDVTRINGNPVPKGQPMPELPYMLAGGFSSVLVMTFSPDNLQYHDYTLMGKITLNATPVLRIDFATKKGQQGLRTIWDKGQSLPQIDNGVALVDADSMRVVRLMRILKNLPEEWAGSVVTVDYGETTIDGTLFWLPRSVKASLAGAKENRTLSYLAEYSECRKFEVSTDLQF